MLRINRDKCGYCGTCVAVCPEDALELHLHRGAGAATGARSIKVFGGQAIL